MKYDEVMTMTRKRKPTTDAAEIIYHRYFRDQPERLAELGKERANAAVGRQVFNIRKKVGKKASSQSKP